MPDEPPSPERQQDFLRLFLSSEREVRRAVMALVPALAEAEDLVQQTALELWRAFDRYDPAQPFTPWACRFARHKTLQWIERRARWQRLLENGLAEELAVRREGLRAPMEARFRHLEDCLDKLPAEQRRLVDGYYYERRELPALAVAHGRSEAAAYKLLQRIRAALLECIRLAQAQEAGA